MRVNIIFLAMCAFVFVSTGLVKADDISEMKEQIKVLQETINAQQKTIEALNAKIQSIETRQEAQTREIKQVPELARKVDELKEAPVGLIPYVSQSFAWGLWFAGMFLAFTFLLLFIFNIYDIWFRK